MEKLSYVSGVATQALSYQTIFAALEAAADKWPNQLAVISCAQDRQLTYRELYDVALNVAQNLEALGLERGERIGIWSPNNIEWLIAQYATACLGAILVNINPAYRRHELRFAIDKVECAFLILAERHLTSDYLAMMQELTPHLVDNVIPQKTVNCPSLRQLIVIGDGPFPPRVTGFSELLTSPSQPWTDTATRIASLQPEDPINIQFTSGTTGTPKGATLSHHNILNNGFFVGEKIALKTGDKICVPVPLYHCFGMVMANLAAVMHGACVVYPAPALNACATLEAISTHKCSALYGVPTMFVSFLQTLENDARKYDLSSLRTGIMAGSPCPINVMKQVIDKMNMDEITICYGMTETSPVSFQSSISDTLDRRVSTIGQVHPHVEVKIIDPDSGRTVPIGTQGELCTRGYSVMIGYWNDGDKTAEVIDRKGWMHTGDLAVLDTNGFGKITGRAKDMIIRGGENIYPLEIEEFFREHPKVADICVFGLPDKKYGEIVAAWVVPKSGTQLSEQDLREFCDNRIARYKIPAKFKFVDGFPMTVTGKVQKFVMREQMSDELGLAEIETA
jgi:fatty-acyl-CoA synthase